MSPCIFIVADILHLLHFITVFLFRVLNFKLAVFNKGTTDILPQPSKVQCNTVLIGWYYYGKLPEAPPPPLHLMHSSSLKT